jgi:hypothetical protein
VSEQQAVSNAATRFGFDTHSLSTLKRLRHPLEYTKELFIRDIFNIATNYYQAAKDALEYCDDPVLYVSARKNLRHTTVVSAYRMRRADIAERVLAPIAAITAFIVIFIYGAVLARVVHVPFTSVPIEMSTGAYFAFMARRMSNKTKRPRRTLAFIGLVTLSIAASLVQSELRDPRYSMLRHVHTGIKGSIGYILLIGFITIGLMIVWTVLANLILDTMIRGTRGRYASVNLVGRLVYILNALTEKPILLRDPNFRNKLNWHLEADARYLQNKIPRSIAVPDPAARLAFQNKCARAAASLKAIQLKLALSGEQAVDDIKKTIGESIIAIATGNYEMLPDGDISSPKEKLIKRLGRTAKTLTIAFIPLGFLIGARYLGLKISSGFNNGAIGFAIIWAAITVISMIDSRYTSNIAEVQSMVSIFQRKSD